MTLRRTSLLYLLLICVAVVLLTWFGFEIRQARRMALATNAKGRLNQLQLALHNYHDTYGSFPPAFFADENGNPMHSWRVLILPLIEEGKLYNAYDFREPWDGPNNARLANRMPAIFHSHTELPSTTNTNLVVITGPGTVFPGSTSTKRDDIRDGLANTILLTEIGHSSIPWLAPQDMSIESMSFRVKDALRPSISSAEWRQPYVVFADSITTYTLDQSISLEALRSLMTIAGGEPVTRDALELQGALDRRVILTGSSRTTRQE